VGFNHIRFDYRVLEGYSIFDFSQVPSLDMLIVLNEKLGHRLKLDSIAQATLGCEKSAEGLQALEWFKQGKMAEIAEYCCFDVKITKLVHEYAAAHGHLFYNNRFGNKLKVEVEW
jgi:DEAD/DEAH box helicase domain-containing protein